MLDGEKLNDAPDGVGVESEQFTAQQRRVASAAGDRSPLFALSQHFIILSFVECSGVPDTTPPIRVTSMKSNVYRLIISKIICRKSVMSISRDPR